MVVVAEPQWMSAQKEPLNLWVASVQWLVLYGIRDWLADLERAQSAPTAERKVPLTQSIP